MPRIPTTQPQGKAIRQLIWDRGYTVTAFADKVGCSTKSIWEICGRSRPTGIELLERIACELGVRPSDISDMEDDEPGAPTALAS